MQEWLGKVGVKTLSIAPGSPWENGCNAGFDGSLRDELLNGEIFCGLTGAKVLIEAWRRHDDTVRPPPGSGLSSASIASSRSTLKPRAAGPSLDRTAAPALARCFAGERWFAEFC